MHARHTVIFLYFLEFICFTKLYVSYFRGNSLGTHRWWAQVRLRREGKLNIRENKEQWGRYWWLYRPDTSARFESPRALWLDSAIVLHAIQLMYPFKTETDIVFVGKLEILSVWFSLFKQCQHALSSTGTLCLNCRTYCFKEWTVHKQLTQI